MSRIHPISEISDAEYAVLTTKRQRIVPPKFEVTTKKVLRTYAKSHGRRHPEGCDCNFCVGRRPVERLVTMIDVLPEPGPNAKAMPSPELERNIINNTNVLPPMDESYETQIAPSKPINDKYWRDPITPEYLEIQRLSRPLKDILKIIRRLALPNINDPRFTEELFTKACDEFLATHQRRGLPWMRKLFANHVRWWRFTTEWVAIMHALTLLCLLSLGGLPSSHYLDLLEGKPATPSIKEYMRVAHIVTRLAIGPGTRFLEQVEAFKALYFSQEQHGSTDLTRDVASLYM